MRPGTEVHVTLLTVEREVCDVYRTRASTRDKKYRYDIDKQVLSAGIVQSVERRALDCEILGSNLPLALLEVALSGHSSGSLTIPKV